jgi:hypothetical protein
MDMSAPRHPGAPRRSRVTYRFFYDDDRDELHIDLQGAAPPQLRLRADVITRRDTMGTIIGYVIPRASEVLGPPVDRDLPGAPYGHGGAVARSILGNRAGVLPDRLRRSGARPEVRPPERR